MKAFLTSYKKSKWVTVASLVLILDFAIIACSGNSSTPQPSSTTKIIKFDATPTTISKGQKVTLAWRAENSPLCKLEANPQGQIKPTLEDIPCISNATEKFPSQTVQYTLGALKNDDTNSVEKKVLVVTVKEVTDIDGDGVNSDNDPDDKDPCNPNVNALACKPALTISQNNCIEAVNIDDNCSIIISVVGLISSTKIQGFQLDITFADKKFQAVLVENIGLTSNWLPIPPPTAGIRIIGVAHTGNPAIGNGQLIKVLLRRLVRGKDKMTMTNVDFRSPVNAKIEIKGLSLDF